jgi:hypothetical protein
MDTQRQEAKGPDDVAVSLAAEVAETPTETPVAVKDAPLTPMIRQYLEIKAAHPDNQSRPSGHRALFPAG